MGDRVGYLNLAFRWVGEGEHQSKCYCSDESVWTGVSDTLLMSSQLSEPFITLQFPVSQGVGPHSGAAH